MPTRFIDIHVLQTLPPSNINRDDTGAPKTAVYGGTRRARVSSQAWKRATRRRFDDLLDPGELGFRTKRLVEKLGERIAARSGLDEVSAQALAVPVLKALGLTLEKPRKRAKAEDDGDQVPKAEYLVFLSAHQLDALADIAVASQGGKIDKKAVKVAADTAHGVDVGLFGRMVADAAELNVDAAVQVAHALSTHAVDTEFDYYTAVDDVRVEEETGAGMIGTIEFTSSTLYRFATVDVDGLRRNLGDPVAASRAAAVFVEGFITSMPTGKQNTFGNRTLPDAVVVTVREDQPLNLVGAFEEAVPLSDHGYLRSSADRLAAHAEALSQGYGIPPAQSWVIRGPESASGVDRMGQRVTLAELVARVSEAAGPSSDLQPA